MLQQLDYLLKDVCWTLAFVEAPEVVVPAPWTDKKDDSSERVPRVQLNHKRSITSSLRRTVAHLYRVGGPLALCRGIAVHICTCIGLFVIGMLSFPFYKSLFDPNLDPELEHTTTQELGIVMLETAATVFAAVVFPSMRAAWVHIVISQPTLRIWYRRLPPYLATLRATFVPVVCQTLSQVLVTTVTPILLKHALGLAGRQPDTYTAGIFSSRNILLALIWLFVHVLDAVACLPFNVAVTRIEASLLPEEEETIVTFDRSFGTDGSNGLRPGLLAESRGALSFREAWQSVTWSEMRRLWIFSAKILAVQVSVNGSFWLVGGKNAWPSGWDPRMI